MTPGSIVLIVALAILAMLLFAGLGKWLEHMINRRLF
jgi:hypothetical protein